MSSKDNTANADIPNINIPTWFELHHLPYNDFIVTKLQMIDNDLCVEDLKLFNIPVRRSAAHGVARSAQGV